MDQALYDRLHNATGFMVKASARYRDAGNAFEAMSLRETLAARFPELHENRTSTEDAE